MSEPLRSGSTHETNPAGPLCLVALSHILCLTRTPWVEYAVKAVENGGTAVGIRCKEGIVLALEKVVTSKLLKAGANKRIATVDRNMGMVSTGLQPDGRHLTNRAREEAGEWRGIYKQPIPISSLADRIGYYVSVYTLAGSVRPFGVTTIIGGWDPEEEVGVDGEVGSGPKEGGGKNAGASGVRRGGPGLYMVEPSGSFWGYHAAATGRGRQAAKAELEKLALHDPESEASNMSLEQAMREAAKVIFVAHEDAKDKEYELEMGWCTGVAGRTKGRFESVPVKEIAEAREWAKREVEGVDEEEEEGGEGEGGEGERMQE
ncbi:MAG: hypothetical protein M1831_007174 [Alyxoria varia]|nr:MAG: hypothetical protein M1831_007174 [Alyxoria varia]